MLRRVDLLVHFVHVLEGVSRLLLEAVDGLLSVPDGAGQRELPPQPVPVHSSCYTTRRSYYCIYKVRIHILYIYRIPQCTVSLT